MPNVRRGSASREQFKKRKRTAVVLVVAALFVALALSFVFGDKGLLRYMKLREQNAALKADIERLDANNRELGHTVESLKTDPDYIEKLAREQGLVKEGEIVYQYEDGRESAREGNR